MSAAWTVSLLLLCRGLGSGAGGEPRSSPRSATLDFGYVPSGVYETLAHHEPGPIGILFHMVHAFLYVVQPNPFPQDLVIRVAKDKFGAIQTEYQKAIYYEIGFVVCALLGVLFFVLMPLVGLLFCLCRCCDNCGGEMHQRQRKNADCQRGLLATLLFSTSLVITAGILCAYAANQHLSSQLKSMRRLVNSNLRDLHTFANDTPAQIDYLVSQYFTAKKYVTADLDNIGVLLGGRIYDELGKEVRPALDGVLNMAGAMHDTKEALENVSMTLEVLQDGNVKLQVNLSLVRSSLNESLDDPACEAVAHICGRIRSSLAQLDISANYSRLPDVADQLNNVNNVLKTDLDAIVQRGFLSFNNTPSLVAEQTTSVARGIKDMLDDIGSNITILPKLFSMHSPLTNFTISISHAHSKIEDLYPEIDRYDFYRWVGCITLCCMVVMVLAFNYLGLLCGILGFDRHATPTTRGCISNTGGNLLMAGVGFSFLFSWVLMAVVTTTFLAGGNVEKLVCEPFHTKELFKVLDTPYLIMPAWKNFIPGYLYNEPDMDLTIESLYTDCEENRGIYSALHLDRVFNITAFLNSRVYAKHVSQKIDGIRVDLRGIVLLETEGRKNLVDFTEAGIGDINYAAYLEEVSVTKRGRERVDTVHVCTVGFHAVCLLARSTLNQSIRYLQATAADLPSKVSDVLNTVDVAQFLISHNASFVVSQETAKFRDTILGYIKQYLEWLVNALATEVAGCKPFSNIVDSLEIVGCSFLMDSMNTFWFGLGGATLFLLPSIIFAVKLAKFYRRMDTEDVYDDIETIPMKNIPAYDTMTRFPRASAPPRHGNW
uniref:Prominin-1-A-like n=1 Tax=Denticeps clupeoides TaxID=299321 RepID=A0AAY4BFU7_9TELE